MGIKDKTDMSEDYDKFHEIPPLAVKDDLSVPLINEDAPWLRRKKNLNTRWGGWPVMGIFITFGKA